MEFYFEGLQMQILNTPTDWAERVDQKEKWGQKKKDYTKFEQKSLKIFDIVFCHVLSFITYYHFQPTETRF